MRAEMTSLFIGTNDVTPRSVPSLQFEVLARSWIVLLYGTCQLGSGGYPYTIFSNGEFHVK